jgi:hypothetical protein
MSSPRVRHFGVRKRRAQCVRVRVMMASTISGTILSRQSKERKEDRRTGEDPAEEEEVDDDVLLFEARDRVRVLLRSVGDAATCASSSAVLLSSYKRKEKKHNLESM